MAEESVEEKFARLCRFDAIDPEADRRSREAVLETPALQPLEMAACRDDFERFCRRWLWLKSEQHGGKLMLLHLNDTQRAVLKTIKSQQDRKLPVRIRVLKARRPGVSTLIQALTMHRMVFWENFNALTIAHDNDTTEKIFAMGRLFYDKLPGFMQPKFRYKSRRNLSFDELLNEHTILTAKNAHAGAGIGYLMVHCSELPRWPLDPSVTQATLYPSVPLIPESIIIEESTARGTDNPFHNDFWETQERMDAGEATAWENVFVPWFRHTLYQLPCGKVEAQEIWASLNEEEQNLVRQYRLKPQQIKWRRYAIEAICNRDVKSFHENYPSTAREAFVSSGRPFFDPLVLDDWRRLAEQAPTYIETPLEPVSAHQGVPDEKPRVFEASLRVFQGPQPGRRYILAADPSEGVAPHAGNPDPDPSVGYVIRDDTLDQVAQLRGHWDPDVFADLSYQVGILYNTALLVVEAHNEGLAVLQALTRYSGPREPYPNLYMRQRLVDGVIPSDAARPKLGWQTDQRTRPQMLLYSRELIRDRIGRIHDLVALKEHGAMQKLPSGEVIVKHGHDDTIICRAMAVYVARERAYEEEPEEPEPSTMRDYVKQYERDMFARAEVQGHDPEGFLEFVGPQQESRRDTF